MNWYDIKLNNEAYKIVERLRGCVYGIEDTNGKVVYENIWYIEKDLNSGIVSIKLKDDDYDKFNYTPEKGKIRIVF